MDRVTKLGFEKTRELQEYLAKRVRLGEECGPYTRKRLFYTEQRLAMIAARLRLGGDSVPPAHRPDGHAV